MNLRLIKIESSKTIAFSSESFGLHEPKNGLMAHFLVENPPPKIKIELIHSNSNYPEFRAIPDATDHNIHISFPIIKKSNLYLPSFIKKMFSDQTAQLLNQLKNYCYPQFLTSDNYGIKMQSPAIMGIVNITPDSFSDGGHYFDVRKAVDHALSLEEEGALIIDVGGESSRPGAVEVSVEEELARIIPVVDGIRTKSDICISVDTIKAKVAEKALMAGANWINDISGLRAEPAMISVVKRYQCPVVIMHMQGIPRNMQDNPFYQNVCLEVDDFFSERIRNLKKEGVEKIILDPGIGFGKRLEDNLNLIRGATLFRRHGYPLLYGTSRKSFIGKLTGKTVEQRLSGSLASIVPLIKNGVNIVRVHDVVETKDFIDVLKEVGN